MSSLTFLCRTQGGIPGRATEFYESLPLTLIACSEVLCNAVAATSGTEIPLVILPVGVEDVRAFFDTWALFTFIESDSIDLRFHSFDELNHGLLVRSNGCMCSILLRFLAHIPTYT